MENKTAIITGASRGLGFALATAFAKKNWNLIINGRNAEALLKAKNKLEQWTTVEAISGDIIDEIHLLQFKERIKKFNGVDLIINNASTIGISPQPNLLEYPIEVIHTIFHTNVIAPLSLIQKLKDDFNSGATIINISSDAAVNAYKKWGGYSASKAALDHMTLILAKENPTLNIYTVDPGDMRTQMHQEAFPGEDISDRPLPEESVPGFLSLIFGQYKSGRYEAKKIENIHSI